MTTYPQRWTLPLRASSSAVRQYYGKRVKQPQTASHRLAVATVLSSVVRKVNPHVDLSIEPRTCFRPAFVTALQNCSRAV